MLYNFLYPLADQFAPLNVLRYPSFRIVMAALSALVLGMLIGPKLIRHLREEQHGQSNVREDTPETHQKKKGTPTMGGELILLCTITSTLLFADLSNSYVWTVLIVFGGFGLIGFVDDFLKVRNLHLKKDTQLLSDMLAQKVVKTQQKPLLTQLMSFPFFARKQVMFPRRPFAIAFA